jgi:hypothetical protein
VAQGYPPRRPPAGAGGHRRQPDGPGGRHGYPEEPDDGYPRYPEEGGYPDDPGYPAQPGGGEYRNEPPGGGYPDARAYSGDPRGPVYPEERRGRRGLPEETGGRDPRERGRPARPERVPAGRPRRSADAFDDDEDVMPWSGQSIYPVGPGRREVRPPRADLRQEEPAYEPDADGDPSFQPADEQEPGDGREPGRGRPETGRGRRAAAARARKWRRRLLVGGVVAGVCVLIAAGVLALIGRLPFVDKSTSSGNGLVTQFQPGEFRTVPNACQAVSSATLSTYLPGKVAEVSQSLGSSTQSECTWTLDTQPNFRVLSVSTQAYSPSLLTSGNGSATAGAVDAYNTELQTLRNPPKSSKQPKAQIGGAVGLGTSAFTAMQAIQSGDDQSDEVTVVVRDRNAVIIVTMQGQESGGGFGPVAPETLRAAALAAAHEALAQLG